MDTRLENRIIPPAASGVILRPGNSLRTSSCILVIRIRFFESVLVTCFLFIEHTYQQKSRSWSSKSSPFHPTGGGGLHPEQGRFISLPDSDYTRYTFTFASSSSQHLDTDCGNWDILASLITFFTTITISMMAMIYSSSCIWGQPSAAITLCCSCRCFSCTAPSLSHCTADNSDWDLVPCNASQAFLK